LLIESCLHKRELQFNAGRFSAAGWITMLNHNVEINHIHSGAICNEIGERLHIAFIRPESNELPLVMQKQLHRLRALDDDCSSEPLRVEHVG